MIDRHITDAVIEFLGGNRIQSISEMDGGLFNRVYRMTAANTEYYLKCFGENAKFAGFPNLPTSAAARLYIAATCHRHAYRLSTARRELGVRVPVLAMADAEWMFVLMEAAEGQLFYDQLHQPEWDGNRHIALQHIVRWLGYFHKEGPEEKEKIKQASSAFKSYKIDLQYTRLLPHLPTAAIPRAERFIESYLAGNTHLLHGDLNSRNLLINSKGKIAVIDFEQGQLGDGLYDLAYLLSEAAIALLNSGQNPHEYLADAFNLYIGINPLCGEAAFGPILSFRIHLAFQILYRLAGPSRKIWTGHLSARMADDVKEWAIGLLANSLL